MLILFIIDTLCYKILFNTRSTIKLMIIMTMTVSKTFYKNHFFYILVVDCLEITLYITRSQPGRKHIHHYSLLPWTTFSHSKPFYFPLSHYASSKFASPISIKTPTRKNFHQAHWHCLSSVTSIS
jgi:hypothetical protein